jgi:hypothetical protein
VEVKEMLLALLGAAPVGPVGPVSPNQSLPGSAEIASLINGGAGWALLACVAAMVVGGGIWAWAQKAGAFQRIHVAQLFVLGGMIGSLVVGAASVLVNFGYSAGASFK